MLRSSTSFTPHTVLVDITRGSGLYCVDNLTPIIQMKPSMVRPLLHFLTWSYSLIGFCVPQP
jgi:hypothetical protein